MLTPNYNIYIIANTFHPILSSYLGNNPCFYYKRQCTNDINKYLMEMKGLSTTRLIKFSVKKNAIAEQNDFH